MMFTGFYNGEKTMKMPHKWRLKRAAEKAYELAGYFTCTGKLELGERMLKRHYHLLGEIGLCNAFGE